MNIYNEKHNAFVNVWQEPEDASKLKDGKVVPHIQKVNGVTFFSKRFSESLGEHWIETSVSKEAILELAEQIKEVESKKVNIPYTSLPF